MTTLAPTKACNTVVPDAALVTKYSRPGPRYTSYPPVPYWPAGSAEEGYREALREEGPRLRDTTAGPGHSLYVHIPFCERRCTYCACNVVISRDHSRGKRYVRRVLREMDLLIDGMGGGKPRLRQIHWGGGTPTWLTADELAMLHDGTAARFDLAADREQSVEVDPRVTSREQLEALRARGLNRVSLGVQDLDRPVQEAIHRVQPLDVTARVIDDARDLGIEGVNVDLVYGLPHQSLEGFGKTIDTVIGLGVDRVALYNFAYLPDRLKHHRAILPEWLPAAERRIDLFRLAAQRFADAGYEMIGLDHFAKRTDELSVAMADGSLHRNFMGYTTRAGSDLFAVGVSSISRVGRYFGQNVKVTAEYEELVAAGRLPLERGMRLSDDDLARERVIQTLMCYGRIDFTAIEAEFGLQLLDDAARRKLAEFEGDQLLRLSGDRLTVTPLGRFFLRNIAMVFDAYLGRPPAADASAQPVKVRFSQTV